MSRDFFSLKNVKSTPGAVIRAFRRNFNITQQELAQITGIAETNISAIENERVDIGVKRAVLIAAALGVNPSSILFPNGYEASYGKEIQAVRRASRRLLAKKRVG